MSLRALITAVLVASSNAAAASPSDTPLSPTGKWIADFAESKCLLSRSYGTATKPLDLAFEQVPMSDAIEIHVFNRGTRDDLRHGQGKIAFGANAPIGVKFGAFLTTSNFRRLDIEVPDDAYSAAKATERLSISVRGEVERSFALPGFAAALGVLHDCVVDLGQHWGLTAEEQSRIREAPKSVQPLANYFSGDDYPWAALRKEATGRTDIRLVINAQGTATDCVVMRTSGNKSLDDATCGILLRKAHFHPAIDVDGKPVKSILVTGVNWIISG